VTKLNIGYGYYSYNFLTETNDTIAHGGGGSGGGGGVVARATALLSYVGRGECGSDQKLI